MTKSRSPGRVAWQMDGATTDIYTKPDTSPAQAHMAFDDEWEQLELLTEDELQAELDTLLSAGRTLSTRDLDNMGRPVDAEMRRMKNRQYMRSMKALGLQPKHRRAS